MPTTDIPEATVVEDLVRDAAAAPSMHNAQPWIFRFRSGDRSLELRADPRRAMPASDPDRRALHIGCGAAPLNLRTAAVHSALSLVAELLPDQTDPDSLALVRFRTATGDAAEQELASLYGAIAARHTSRHPFTDQPIPRLLREQLAAEARREGATLTFPTGWHHSFILELVEEADLEAAYRGDPDEQLWLRLREPASGPPVDGITKENLGPARHGGRTPARNFARRHSLPGRAVADFELMPQLGILSTRWDEPQHWLTAGEAVERVLLRATQAGLGTSIATQALEQPELRWLLRDPALGAGHVQMVLRLGFGPRGTASPRRPVRDILEILP